MPGDSFSRRVARAASAGGGRTYRSETPLGWYALVLVICLVGVGLVAYSRYERLHPTVAAVKPAVPPTAKNEWQVAVAVDICGKLQRSALPASTSAETAFATTGDGVVDIQPQRSPVPSAFEGTHAILQNFLVNENISLTTGHLQLPGKVLPAKKSRGTSTTSTTSSSSSTTSTTGAGSSTSSTSSTSTSTTTTTVPIKRGPARTYATGQSCGGKTGVVEVAEWASPTAKSPTIVTKDPQLVRFKNGQLLTVAFVAKGTTPLQPPAAARKQISDFLVTNPNGTAPATTPTSLPVPTVTTPSTAGSTSPTTGRSGASTSTTSGSSSTTTSAGSNSTTSST